MNAEIHYHQVSPTVLGIASWYGEEHANKLMANGQPFNPRAMTCATMVWPLGTKLYVEYAGRFLTVVVTDRGPANHLGRLIDLSSAAFAQLAPLACGIITVRVTPAQQ